MLRGWPVVMPKSFSFSTSQGVPYHTHTLPTHLNPSLSIALYHSLDYFTPARAGFVIHPVPKQPNNIGHSGNSDSTRSFASLNASTSIGHVTRHLVFSSLWPGQNQAATTPHHRHYIHLSRFGPPLASTRSMISITGIFC